MKFKFNEITDYGQDVLELQAITMKLSDPEKLYTKQEVNKILNELYGQIQYIRISITPRGGLDKKYLGVEEE